MGKENIKRERKRIRLGFIIVVIVALAVLLTLFFVSNKVNFLVKDELNLRLSPLNQVLYTKNKEPINVNFTITNSNLAQCKTECNFSVIDLKDNKKVYSSKETLEHNEKRTKEYVLSVAGQGSGQLIYNFEAECKNIKTILCQSSDQAKYVSALVIVNYELTDEEKAIKESAKAKLEMFVSRLNDLSLLIESNEIAIGALPDSIIEKNNLTGQNNNIKTEVKLLEKIQEQALQLWNNENYIALKDTFSDEQLSEAENLKNKTIEINKRVLNIIEKRNNDIDVLKKFENKKQEILEMTGFYSYEKNRKNNEILGKISSAINNIHDAYYSIKSDENVVEEKFNLELNAEYSEINTTIFEYQQTKSEGLKLLIENQDILNNIKNESKLSPIEFNCSVLNENIIEIGEFNSNASTVNNTRNTEFYDENCRDEAYETYDSSEIIENLDDLNLSSKKFEKIRVVLPDNPSFSFVLNENNAKCCIFDECQTCCEGSECNTEKNYPVLFIHGHSVFSSNDPNTLLFTDIQRKLNENGFINAGEFDIIDNTNENIMSGFGRMDKPFTFRASYYYISQYGIGNYKLSVQKSERIENYALRLKEIIDLIKYRTGKDKVNIVAHSMGGLVTREYLSIFGYNNVNKVILINTPNHGVSGKVESLCSVFGSKKECEDMGQNSVFLTRLNNQKMPESASVYSIRSVGCMMDNDQIGDGIVTNSSAYLEGAHNFEIKGKCTDALQASLHGDVLIPDKYPEMYNLIEEILKE